MRGPKHPSFLRMPKQKKSEIVNFWFGLMKEGKMNNWRRPEHKLETSSALNNEKQNNDSSRLCPGGSLKKTQGSRPVCNYRFVNCYGEIPFQQQLLKYPSL